MDDEGTSISIGSNGMCFELIYLVGMSYEGQIDFSFIFVHKGILVIMRGCTGVSDQSLQEIGFLVTVPNRHQILYIRDQNLLSRSYETMTASQYEA